MGFNPLIYVDLRHSIERVSAYAGRESFHKDPECSTMRRVYQVCDQASGRQGLSPSGRLLRLLFLAVLWVYLPLEAFDADADVGLEDAVVQCGSPRDLSQSSVTPGPPSPAGPAIGPARLSVSWGAAASAPGALHGALDHQVRLLRASCLCARSRIGELTLACRARGRDLFIVYVDASSGSSHGFTSCGEGCFF